MELREALTHLEEIRLRLARTEVFRGYRALPLAISGALAIGAGAMQAVFIPEPMTQLRHWLALWIGVAGAAIFMTAATIMLRDCWSASPSGRAITRLAVGQFAPCLISAGMLTFVMVRSLPDAVWMLPGLWQILFSQGIFASCRLLPRPIFLVGCFYLCSGLIVLMIGQGDIALSPWLMAVPFAIGQLVTATILYWTLERHDSRRS